MTSQSFRSCLLFVILFCFMFFSVKPKETKKGFKKSEKVKTPSIPRGGRGGESIKKKGALVLSLRGKKRFLYLLGCTASKDSQRELLRYLLRY